MRSEIDPPGAAPAASEPDERVINHGVWRLATNRSHPTKERFPMARNWVHTVPKGSEWKNEIEGDGDLSTHDTKEQAVEAGRAEARRRQTEHVIHNTDGSIAERNSYGSDPADVPG